jgi:simple sugar transport system permease protein
MSENKSKNKLIVVLTSTKNALLVPLISIILAMMLAVFIVMLVKGEGFITAAVELFSAIWKGSFGSKTKFYTTIVNATPLIFTGLANAVAFKTGLFNIGAEGQFIMGILIAAMIGLIPGIPAIAHIILILLGGIIIGGLWAGIPGLLKAKRGTNEVVNTIMMNFIAVAVSDYFVLGPLNKPGTATTNKIQESAELFRFMGDKYRINVSVFIAIICAILVYYFFWKTVQGYEIRAVGLNPHAAEYGGINVKRNIVLAMVISGMLAGLGGATHLAGVQHQGYQLASFTNYGFNGITVALLAKSHPIGVIFSALLLGALNSSALTLQVADIPKEIVSLIQAIIIIFVAADYLFKWLKQKRKKGAMKNEQ